MRKERVGRCKEEARSDQEKGMTRRKVRRGRMSDEGKEVTKRQKQAKKTMANGREDDDGAEDDSQRGQR